MKYRKLLTFLSILVLALSSCTRDPKVKAQRYVEQGNKFFAKEKFKDASLMYRNAVKQDPRFGEAYYRLALTDMKLYALGDAFRAFKNTVELQPGNVDAKTQLANLYLLLSVQDRPHAVESVEEASKLAGEILKLDPKSYDGHRLMGQIDLVKNDSADAIAEFAAANDAKPLQPEVITPYFQALTANNRFPEAEKLAYQLIDKNKNYSPMYDLLSNQYLRLHRLDDAEHILKLKTENNPKSTRSLLDLAIFYIADKRRPEAEAIFKKMTDEKEYPDGHLLAGDFFFLRLHEFDRARAEYEAAINAFPKDKAVYQKRLVELFANTGNNSGANQLLATILKDNPKDSEAVALRAGLMLTTGNHDQIVMAANEFQSLVAKSPDNAVLRFNLARALAAKGDAAQAILQLEAAIKLRPDHIGARQLLAALYMTTGDNPKALKASEDLIAHDRNNLAGHLVRSAALLGLNERDQARKELDFIVSTFPQNVEARYQVGLLDYMEKDYKASGEVFGKLNQEYPKDHRGLKGVTETLAAENRMDDAIKVMEKAIQTEPERNDLKLILANFDVRAAKDHPEKYDSAIQIYQGLLDKDPKNADLLIRIAETYRRKGDLNMAINEFRAASQAAPSDTTSLLELAMLMDGTGRSDQAQPIYQQIIKVQPDNWMALNNVAFFKAEKGIDLDSAETMAQEALQKQPNSAEVADTLGWIYIKKNQSEEAVRLFRDLVAKWPDNAKFHYHFAKALYQKGDKPSTKRELETALKVKEKPSKDDEAEIRDLLAKL